MRRIQAKKHELGTYEINKVSLFLNIYKFGRWHSYKGLFS